MTLFCVILIRKYDESQELENDPDKLNQILSSDLHAVRFLKNFLRWLNLQKSRFHLPKENFKDF